MPNPLPPLTTTPPASKKVQRPGQIKKPPHVGTAYGPPTAEAPVYELQRSPRVPAVAEPTLIKTAADAYAIAAGPAPAVQVASSFSAELRTPGALRRAILLREILGPPRSLAPLEQ